MRATRPLPTGETLRPFLKHHSPKVGVPNSANLWVLCCRLFQGKAIARRTKILPLNRGKSATIGAAPGRRKAWSPRAKAAERRFDAYSLIMRKMMPPMLTP